MFALNRKASVIETPPDDGEVSDEIAVDSNNHYPIIVVGAGPVGTHFVNKVLSQNPQQDVLLFGDEPYLPYDRVRLSNVLAGTLNPDLLQLSLPAEKNLQQHYNCLVTSIDCQAKSIIDDTGNVHRFSSLILATGSSPHIPDIKGIGCKRVYTFRDLRDAEALIARSARSRRIVVIGGGLLGLETAKAMQRWNTHVTVVQQAPHLMNRQLDSKAAKLLLNTVTGLGIDVYLNSGVGEILGEVSSDSDGRKTVVGVKLRNGTILDCDTVIFAAGITPNIALAVDAKINVGRGIKVDEHLQTSESNIYAIGECAEYNKQVYGLVAPGIEQASVLAENIAGNMNARYLGSINASALKVVGEDVFSIGEIDTEVDRSLKTYSYYKTDTDNSNTDYYRCIFLKRNRLVGALAIGAWPEQAAVRRAVMTKQRMLPWRVWSFCKTGNLFGEKEQDNANHWQNSATICSCKALTKGDIDKSICAGCDSVEKVMERTGAGTMCGSCQPLLAGLVEGTPVSIARDSSFSLIGGGGLIAVILVAVFIGFDPIPYASTVQLDFSIDELWRDSFYKQFTGFSLLGASVLGLLLSLRKRFDLMAFMTFNSWRLVHVSLGILCLLMLVLHTGFRMGDNLNLWLMINFTSLAFIGALAGIVIGWDKLLGVKLYQRLRSWFTWGHIISFWPLPVLLGFHIVSVYYF